MSKILLSLILAFTSFTTLAASETFEVYGITFTLTDKRCTEPKIKKMAGQLGMDAATIKKLKAGQVEDAADGKQKMCYLEAPDNSEVIFVIDILGNSGVVPKKM